MPDDHGLAGGPAVTRVVLAAVILAGCSAAPTSVTARREPPPSPTGRDRAEVVAELKTMIDLTRRTCACQDAACFETIDTELASYAQTAPLDDPMVDDDETSWPPDLDALGRAMVVRLMICAIERHQFPRGLAFIDLRKLTMLRDRACGCQDADCAGRVVEKYDEIVERKLPADEQTREQIQSVSAEAMACAAEALYDQYALDVKELRDIACACEDTACADAVSSRLESFSRHSARYESAFMGTTLPPHIEEAFADLGSCLQAARAAGS